MNFEFPTDPRKALEASLTALLLGELPDEQARFLRQAIATDPELAKTFEALKKTIELVREMECRPVSEPMAEVDAPKLSDQRRHELLERFKTVQPAPFKERARQRFSWVLPVAAAGVLMMILATMLLPALSRTKSRSMAGLPAYSENRESLNSTNALAFSALQSDEPSARFTKAREAQDEMLLRRYSKLPPPGSSAISPETPKTRLLKDIALPGGGKRDLVKSVPGVAGEENSDWMFQPQEQALADGFASLAHSPAPALGLSPELEGGGLGGANAKDKTQPASWFGKAQQPALFYGEGGLGGISTITPNLPGPDQGIETSADSAQSNAYSLNIVGYATVNVPTSYTPAANPLNTVTNTRAISTTLRGFYDDIRQREDSEKPMLGRPSATALPSVKAEGGTESGVEAGRKLALAELDDSKRQAGTEKLKENLVAVNDNLQSFKKEVRERPKDLAVALRGGGRNEPEDVGAAKQETTPLEPQPEIRTLDNPFSTFSLNVSDVSFKLAKASLEKGVLPEPASIRSEEFINAFDYRDPEPPAGVPVAFAWERARSPFAQNRDLMRFSIKTAAAGRQAGRPLNVVLLLDNSGSMERADRVSILHEALRVLATQLGAQDTFSVVTFARTARLWVDGIPGDQAGRVADEISNLTPQGGTNLEEAMNLAYQTALRHYTANGINRVVLLTDGAANLGDTDAEALKKKVETNRKQGIALDCFGIGWEGYNDDLLEVLTRNGDGRYGFLNTPEEAASGFAEQLAGALHVAANDVKVQVEFNTNRVSAYRQIGYAHHQLAKEQFRDNSVNAAAMGGAESGNALYVIESNPQGEGPLAIVRVRYRIPGTGEYREHEWTVPFDGVAVPLDQASPAMRLSATAAAFSEWLATSPYASDVTLDRLLGYLNGVPSVYGADSRPQNLESMIRQSKALSGK